MVGSHQDFYESIIKAGHLNGDAVYMFEKCGDKKTICHAKDLFENITVLEKEAFKNIKKSDRILDIGAGGGRISRYLQEKGYNVTALDKSKNICETLKRSGVKRVVNADALSYSPKRKFTAVLFVKTYSIFDKNQENIASFFRRLKEKVIGRGGRFFVVLDDTKSSKTEIVKRRFIRSGEIGPWFISLHPSFEDIVQSVQGAGFEIEKSKKNRLGEYFLILKRL